MTKSESCFRLRINRLFPGAFIRKIQDFKTGAGVCQAGLPDYLVIHDGVTEWFEVKLVKSSCITLHDFTNAQMRVFYCMVVQGARVNLWVQRGGCKKYTFCVVEVSVRLLEKLKDKKRVCLFGNDK